MAWFKVDDKLHSHVKAAKAGTDALGLWVICGSWCADQLSNGFVPNYIARRLDPKWLSGSRKLVAAGLWVVGVNDGDEGWWFHDWAEYQPTREDIEAKRSDARERMRKLRGSSREQHANERGSSEVVPDSRPDPTQREDLSSELRPDVAELLDHLDRCIVANGAKKPNRTKANLNAARLLIDRDGRDPDEARQLITWATSDDFWRSNILSMVKFREKYDQLRLRSGIGHADHDDSWDRYRYDPDTLERA